MKYIIVILLTPVYIAIQIFKAAIGLVEEIVNPFADAMRTWIDDMYEFWFKD